jgi:hypothetical protein
MNRAPLGRTSDIGDSLQTHPVAIRREKKAQDARSLTRAMQLMRAAWYLQSQQSWD